MDLKDPKSLKKLAAICRKAGIKTFKSGDFEFTLTDDLPRSDKKTKKSEALPATAEVETDEPSHEQLLFWSGVDLNESSTRNTDQ